MENRQWGNRYLYNDTLFDFNIYFAKECYLVGAWDGGVSSNTTISFVGIKMQETTQSAAKAYITNSTSIKAMGYALWVAIGK